MERPAIARSTIPADASITSGATQLFESGDEVLILAMGCASIVPCRHAGVGVAEAAGSSHDAISVSNPSRMGGAKVVRSDVRQGGGFDGGVEVGAAPGVVVERLAGAAEEQQGVG